MLGKYSVSDLPAVYFDGQWRVLGMIPSDDNHDFPKWGDRLGAAGAFPLQEIDLSWYHHRILNQGQTSSCVGHGCASGMEIAWKQQGNQQMDFNPYFVYGLINNGRDQGAMISDALTALKNSGVCPQADLPPGVMFRQQFPQKAFESAANYKMAMAYKCSNFDEICQAINLGFVTPLGIMVGSNFGQVDQEGVCPLPNGGGGGHCILGVGLKQSQRYGWLIKIQNSWGDRWGRGGFAYLRREHFQGMPPDAFAIQAPTGNNAPPVVRAA